MPTLPDSCVTDAGWPVHGDHQQLRPPGPCAAHASSTVSVSGTTVTVETDGVAPNSDDAVKTYVDAKIEIDPDGQNVVGDPHTFITTVWVDDGTGSDAGDGMGTFDRAPDADVEVTLVQQWRRSGGPPGSVCRPDRCQR